MNVNVTPDPSADHPEGHALHTVSHKVRTRMVEGSSCSARAPASSTAKCTENLGRAGQGRSKGQYILKCTGSLRQLRMPKHQLLPKHIHP